MSVGKYIVICYIVYSVVMFICLSIIEGQGDLDSFANTPIKIADLNSFTLFGGFLRS